MKSHIIILSALSYFLSSSSFFLASYSHKQRFSFDAFAIKYVTTQSSLDIAIEELKACTEIALDLEFDRDRFAYGTTLCLIQVNANGNTFLIDPMADIELIDFYKSIIENAGIEKVIHAPSEDIRIMQLLGYTPTSIFDTERCAKLLNFHFTALSSVVKEVLNVTLDKEQQTSNWLKRPLTAKQLDYAALDVLHLSVLKNKMIAMAKEKGILHWVQEENSAWDTFRLNDKSSTSLASKKDSAKFSDFELYCYNALLQQRDIYAKVANKPGHFMIPKDILVEHSLTKNTHMPIVLKNRKDVHPMIRKATVEREFESVLKKARTEAKELNLSRSFLKWDDTRDDKLILLSSQYPALHKHLCDTYGNATANHILPNKLMLELATNRTTVEDLPFEYKKKVFRDFLKGSEGFSSK